MNLTVPQVLGLPPVPALNETNDPVKIKVQDARDVVRFVSVRESQTLELAPVRVIVEVPNVRDRTLLLDELNAVEDTLKLPVLNDPETWEMFAPNVRALPTCTVVVAPAANCTAAKTLPLVVRVTVPPVVGTMLRSPVLPAARVTVIPAPKVTLPPSESPTCSTDVLAP